MKDILHGTLKELSFNDLPYAYDALEPYIDGTTMEIHHSKHHKAYFDNMIKAVTDTEMAGMTLQTLFADVEKVPVGIRNNAGGFFNHLLFWDNLSSQGGKPGDDLQRAIEENWGTVEKFMEEFSQAALSRFGSGWAWLSLDANKKLFISSTPNQDNPLMTAVEKQGKPLLGLDVWEHAYYLKYQNRRPEYIQNFWHVVNWGAVEKRYYEAMLK